MAIRYGLGRRANLSSWLWNLSRPKSTFSPPCPRRGSRSPRPACRRGFFPPARRGVAAPRARNGLRRLPSRSIGLFEPRHDPERVELQGIDQLQLGLLELDVGEVLRL